LLREDLRALLDKYETLVVLRERREAVEAAGDLGFAPGEAEERRLAFRALARRFPGALRELDRHSARVLRGKAEAVRRAESPARWMLVTLDFHAFLREVLAVKHFLAVHAPVPMAIDEAMAAACRAAVPASAGAWDGRADSVDRWRRPPSGRVLPAVVAEVAARHGLSIDEARHDIFGAAGIEGS
jgi:hypothetical protein